MITDAEIITSLYNLEQYAKINHYSGFDPYDALRSPILNSLKNRFLKLIATQILVYLPINLRHFLKIEPEKNPKAFGIFLQTYCNLFKHHLIEKQEFEITSTELVNFLIKNQSTGYSGYCWGFNFDWQDLSRYTKKDIPTIVITSYVANSFLDLYEITQTKKYLEIARDSCNFLLKDLYIAKTEKGICFSYTPIDKSFVHNANVLGAALLARVYALTQETILLEYSKQAFNFLISHQKRNGSWAYSVNLNTGKERSQLDFHQGFILDSFCDFIKYSKLQDEEYKKILLKGAEFYILKQFNKNGQSQWRLPKHWPIDIHNQAQGIISCIKLYSVFKEKKYLEFSKIIADWTIKNMQDPSGYFYFQKWPFYINKIPYMRWNQAWMLLALSSLLTEAEHDKKN